MSASHLLGLQGPQQTPAYNFFDADHFESHMYVKLDSKILTYNQMYQWEVYSLLRYNQNTLYNLIWWSFNLGGAGLQEDPKSTL